MGLDMYAYAAAREGQQADYWEGVELDKTTGEFTNTQVAKPQEIAYWRKHPSLHGWFEAVYRSRGGSGDMFNGIELELTSEDLDLLEAAVKVHGLPHTEGFFFGDDAAEYYREQDLKFIREARSWIFMGARVFYNSSW
jgi:hypothetical protein